MTAEPTPSISRRGVLAGVAGVLLTSGGLAGCGSPAQPKGPGYLFYRKDFLDAAGVSAEVKSADELFALGKELTDAKAGRWAFDDLWPYLQADPPVRDAGHDRGAGGEVLVVARIGSLRPTVATRPAPAGPIRLRIDVLAALPADRHPRKEPDVLRLGVEAADGAFDVLAELDGRYLSTEVAGGFTGRVIGMYAASGTVRFDWFDYEPLDHDTGPGQVILAP
ncbi:beta-xylosidase family glycoside hydrolase [Nonomuraea sp. NPDC003707]